jgi:hypothetical protein
MLKHTESRQILLQILEDILARYLEVVQSTSGLHADDFFWRVRLTRSNSGSNRRAADVGAISRIFPVPNLAK